MKHSLERLYYLIHVRINPINTAGIDASSRFLEIWINETITETESIRTYLLQKSVDSENEEAFVHLVHQSQSALIRFLDKVFAYMDPSSALYGLYDTILKLLDKLLYFIESHYPRYFNKEEKIPDHVLNQTQSHIKKELEYLEQTVFTSTDPGLKKLICHHLKKLTQAGNYEFICYNNVAYIKELVSELKDMFLGPQSTSQQLMNVLISMNFNTTDLFHYYVAYLESAIAACHTPAQKKDALRSALKKLNQLPEMPGIAFKPKMKNLKEQIRTWITEEITYLDQQQAFSNTTSVHSLSTQDIDDDQKLHTSLSVHQLAIFIRAARDAGVLTNKNQSDLFKIFAKIFRTPQAETISPESLRSKYYTAEPKALEAFKDILMKMFNKIQSY